MPRTIYPGLAKQNAFEDDRNSYVPAQQEASPEPSLPALIDPGLSNQSDSTLQMLYALSPMFGRASQQSVGKMLELTRQNRAVANIASTMAKANEAVNNDKYDEATAHITSALQQSNLYAPEFQRALVPMMDYIQRKQQDFLGKQAILRDMAVDIASIPEGNTPQEKAFYKSLKEQKTTKMYLAYQSAGLNPDALIKMNEADKLEPRPQEKLEALLLIQPKTGKSVLSSYGAVPKTPEDVPVDSQRYIANQTGLTARDVINMTRSSDPTVAKAGEYILTQAQKLGGHAALMQNVGVADAQSLEQTPGGVEGHFYGRQGVSPLQQGVPQQQMPGQQVPATIPQAAQGKGVTNFKPPKKVEQTSEGITIYHADGSKATYSLPPTEGQGYTGQPGQAANVPQQGYGVPQGQTVKERQEREREAARVQSIRANPPVNPNAQPRLDRATGDIIDASQVPVDDPNSVPVTENEIKISAHVTDAQKALDAFEKFFEHTANTIGLPGSTIGNKAQHLARKLPWIGEYFSKWANLEEMATEFDRRYQNVLDMSGTKNVGAEHQRQNLYTVGPPEVTRASIEARKRSLESIKKSLVPPTTVEPLKNPGPPGVTPAKPASSGGTTSQKSSTPGKTEAPNVVDTKGKKLTPSGRYIILESK